MITFDRVSVRYGAHRAVEEVSFSVEDGGVTALVGPSGSGKSSLLLAVNRLHDLDDDAVVTGEVSLGGIPVSTMNPYTLRKRVGLIFQRPTPFPLSIRENLAFPLRAHGIHRSEVDGRVEAALRRAAVWNEVKDRLAAPATGLSGGQQQRLCIARALAMDPEVLLLDEPCASLDPAATALVEETLRSLVGTTLLLVTHNHAQAHRLARRCACLWDGRLIDEGPTERVFSSPKEPRLGDWFAGRMG